MRVVVVPIGVLASPPADRRDLLPFIPGAILWTILFGFFPLNWTIRKHRAAE